MNGLRVPTEQERVQALLQAGEVERLHAVPHVNNYNVGFHSWGVAVIITLLHPNPSANLLKAALLHDVGERYVGDVPSSIKWMGETAAEARRLHQQVEDDVLRLFHVFEICKPLDNEEQLWLKGADMLEFLIWCRRQMAMGNTNVVHVCRNAFNALEQAWKANALPEEIYDAALYITGVQTPDLHHFGEDNGKTELQPAS